MFREGYDAGWVAKSGGRTLLHARANDLFNAYYVERPGEIDIEYAPRNLAIVGEIISTVSASLLLVYLAAYLWRRRR
jgi:uncharacterized membrane protein YfhO